jgi:replicative DNA helicase
LAKIVAKIEIEAEKKKKQQGMKNLVSIKYEEELKAKKKLKRRDEEIEKFNRLVKLSNMTNPLIRHKH